jgi:hypothetical protein
MNQRPVLKCKHHSINCYVNTIQSMIHINPALASPQIWMLATKQETKTKIADLKHSGEEGGWDFIRMRKPLPLRQRQPHLLVGGNDSSTQNPHPAVGKEKKMSVDRRRWRNGRERGGLARWGAGEEGRAARVRERERKWRERVRR